jgi:hypothetical protein
LNLSGQSNMAKAEYHQRYANECSPGRARQRMMKERPSSRPRSLAVTKADGVVVPIDIIPLNGAGEGASRGAPGFFEGRERSGRVIDQIVKSPSRNRSIRISAGPVRAQRERCDWSRSS